MIFNNLTHLHLKNAQVYKPQMTFDELHKEIKDSYITHHVSANKVTLFNEENAHTANPGLRLA